MTAFTITEDFPKSEVEFDDRFSDPKACYEYLFLQKWPGGFICRKCGHGQYWYSKRNLYICTQCQHQHSLTAGTIMDSSKSPITRCFKAMWWFTSAATGLFGPGSKSSGAAPFAMSVKNCPDVLKWMSFSLAVKGPVNAVAAPKTKQSSRLPSKDETLKNGWGAFDFTLHWTVPRTR